MTLEPPRRQYQAGQYYPYDGNNDFYYQFERGYYAFRDKEYYFNAQTSPTVWEARQLAQLYASIRDGEILQSP